MADTRKDKRAPISLKVRFKSATLDEFIEQYSEDISRGGIFIKSKTPMSVGTLLKFEFQLKDESRLIHGVGRVVWRRESGGSEPPGMGIKFIKMDPESRSLVDEMVQGRGDAPGRFEAGADPKPQKKSGGFFPSTTPESELPAPEDRTQVRHASEFLASALAEGSASSASEAETEAEEARKRTEEIERKRAEAKKKRKPRIKKTLVGMGIPAIGENDDLAAALDKAKAATEERKKADAPDSGEAKSDEAKSGEAKSDAADSGEAKSDDSKSDDSKSDDSKSDEAKSDDSKSDDAKADDSKSDDAKSDDAKAAAAASDTKSDDSAETKADEPGAKADKKADKDEAKSDESAAKADKKADKPKADKPKPKPIAKAEPKPKPASDERKPVAAAATLEPEESGGGMGMIIFALIAVAAIGAIVYLQMQPGEQEVVPGTDTTTDVVDPPPEVEDPPLDIEEPPPEPEVEMMAVALSATPEGATFTVDGEPAAVEDGSIELPMGQAVTVVAHLDGHVNASQEVTAAEGQEALEFALEPMAYVIAVTTVPDDAQVRGGGGSSNGSGEIELSGAPDDAVSLAATARGFQRGTAEVEPGAFTERDGRMVASVTITLEERQAPTPRPRPRPTPPTGDTGSDEPDPPEAGGTDEPTPAPTPAPAPEPAPTPAPEPAPTAAPDNPF